MHNCGISFNVKKGHVHKTAVYYCVTYTACILHTTVKKAIWELLIIISIITLLRECCVKPFNLSVTNKSPLLNTVFPSVVSDP